MGEGERREEIEREGGERDRERGGGRERERGGGEVGGGVHYTLM